MQENISNNPIESICPFYSVLLLLNDSIKLQPKRVDLLPKPHIELGEIALGTQHIRLRSVFAFPISISMSEREGTDCDEAALSFGALKIDT